MVAIEREKARIKAQKAKEKNETKKKIGTTESLNPEHPVPVPKSRPTQKDAEHAAMMETACSARDDTERESYLPREPITLFDLFNTMQNVMWL